MPSYFLPTSNISLASDINSSNPNLLCIHTFCTTASNNTNCSINDSDIRSPTKSGLFIFSSTYGGAPSTTSGSATDLGRYRGLERISSGSGGGLEP